MKSENNTTILTEVLAEEHLRHEQTKEIATGKILDYGQRHGKDNAWFAEILGSLGLTMKKVRITETRVGEYIPNLTDEFYRAQGCTNIDLAVQADEVSLKKGESSLDELCPELPVVQFVLEIVDIDD